jgi:predicted DNA-binding transcriptional regulator AlpA
MPLPSDDHDHLVTIPYFTNQMLGVSRYWFYKHDGKDPDLPKRIMVGDKPLLSFRECLAYMERLKARRSGLPKPKRKVGRPRKIT